MSSGFLFSKETLNDIPFDFIYTRTPVHCIAFVVVFYVPDQAF